MRDSGHIFRGNWFLNNGSDGNSASTMPTTPVRFIFDASNSASLTLAGSLVDSWASTGTNTVVANNGGATTRGTYNSTDDYISFDGSNDEYSLGVGAELVSTVNWHMFAVINVAAISGTYGAGASFYNDPVFCFAQYGGIRLRNNAGSYEVQATVFDGGYKAASATGLLLNTTVLAEAKVTGSVIAAAINGGSFTTAAAGESGISNGYAPQIGFASFADYHYNGKIYEILVFSDDLSDTDRTSWVDYLMAKWQIT